MAITVKTVLRTTSSIRKVGTYPVCLCVTHNRKRNYIALLNTKPEQWDTTRLRVTNKFPNWRVFNELIVSKEHHALQIICIFRNKRSRLISKSL